MRRAGDGGDRDNQANDDDDEPGSRLGDEVQLNCAAESIRDTKPGTCAQLRKWALGGPDSRVDIRKP
jgi:hypothetical protein